MTKSKSGAAWGEVGWGGAAGRDTETGKEPEVVDVCCLDDGNDVTGVYKCPALASCTPQ